MLDHSCVQYKAGGSYRRHIDDRPGLSLGAGTVRRAFSILLYLTPDDWQDADGGALRVHSHPAMLDPATFDVMPTAGTLIVFESASVPHEVLETRRERVVLAGWLQEEARA